MCSPELLDVLRIQNHLNRPIFGRVMAVLVQPTETSVGEDLEDLEDLPEMVENQGEFNCPQNLNDRVGNQTPWQCHCK